MSSLLPGNSSSISADNVRARAAARKCQCGPGVTFITFIDKLRVALCLELRERCRLDESPGCCPTQCLKFAALLHSEPNLEC